MRRLLPLLLLPLFAVAAPAPKERLSPEERLKKYWGKAALPDEKCAATATVNGLTLATGGGVRPDLYETAAKAGIGVRTEWPAGGDFEATVKLVRTTEPTHDAPRRGSDARVWSGLYVGAKNKHDVQSYVWLGRQLRADEEKAKQKKYFDHALWLQDGGSGTRLDGIKPAEEVWVRITRKGDKWTCGRSANGTDWDTWKITPDLSDAVTVGVFLTQDVDLKCEAVFADFSVTSPKAEKK